MNRLWHLILLIPAVVVLVAASDAIHAQDTSSTVADAEEAFAAGQQLMQEEKYAEAITQFNKVTQIDQTAWQALLFKGKALNELEDYNAAIQAFKQALDVNGSSAEAFNGRGEAYLELGSADFALKDFERAAELDRSNPEILSNIGHMRTQYLGDPEGGLRYLEDALAMNPEDARAYRDKGLAHAQLREYEEAMTALDQAAELAPNDHENYLAMARVYLVQEDFEKAIDALTQAIEAYEPTRRTDPKTYVDGYTLRSQVRMRLAAELAEDDPEASQAAYEAVIDDADAILKDYADTNTYAGGAYYRKGIAQRMLGQYGAAIESLTEAIQTISNDTSYLPDAFLRRGICWHNQGYEDLARKDFERAISVDFQSPLPHFWIGLSYAAEGDYRQAINHYSEAVDKRQDYALAFVNRGLAYYRLEDYEKAIDNFNEAISHEPLEPEHYYKRGMAHMQLEQYEKAVTSFADALRKAPEMEKAREQMSRAQEALGNSQLGALYQQ